jgi:hypothetical protein
MSEREYFARVAAVEMAIVELIGDDELTTPHVAPLDTRRVAVSLAVLEDILDAALRRLEAE